MISVSVTNQKNSCCSHIYRYCGSQLKKLTPL